MQRLTLSTTLRQLRSAAHNGRARLLWFSLCATFLTWPLFQTSGKLNEFRDAQFLQNYEWTAVESLLRFHELPLWNPYACGGLYALGTPQARFAAPTFLLSLLFGPLRAPALIAFVLSLLGMEGMYRYARGRTASALAPALLAPLFAGLGFMPASFFNGWLQFYGFLLVPWVLYGVQRAARGDVRGVSICAASFAFIAGFGGTYPAPFSIVLALLEVGRLSGERALTSRRLPCLRVLALTLTATGLVSAFRMWPVAESLIAAPRVMAGAPGHTFTALADMLFHLAAPRGHNLTDAGLMYIGSGFVALLLLSVFHRRAWFSLLLVFGCGWAALGYAASPSLFGLLRQLPVLSVFRYPERYLIVGALFATEATILGLDRLSTRLRRAPLSLTALLTIVLGLFVVVITGQAQNAERVVDGMWLAPPPARIEQPFRQSRGNRWLMAHLAPVSLGSISCGEAYPVPMSELLRGDLPAEQYLLDPSAGSVAQASFSPNRLVLNAKLNQATLLLVNQNYHTGWKVNVGHVISHQGLLAVALPAGEHRVELRFRPRSFSFGLLVSLIAVLGLVALELRRRRLSQALFGGATLVGALGLLVSPEPFPSAPLPLNADRSAALVEALPPGAVAVQARFDLPLTLEGVSWPAVADEDGNAAFALFFKVVGPVARDVVIHVEFTSESGKLLQLDHEVVAASLYFAAAPRNVLLRDVGYAKLGSSKEAWTMKVSLQQGVTARRDVKIQGLDGCADGACALEGNQVILHPAR